MNKMQADWSIHLDALRKACETWGTQRRICEELSIPPQTLRSILDGHEPRWTVGDALIRWLDRTDGVSQRVPAKVPKPSPRP